MRADKKSKWKAEESSWPKTYPSVTIIQEKKMPLKRYKEFIKKILKKKQ